MANEISAALTYTAIKATTYRQVKLIYAKTRDWTGDLYQTWTQVVGNAAYEALAKGDVGSLGEVVIRNLDATNNLLVSFDSGTTAHLTLLPGAWTFLPLTAALDITTVQVKAGAATVDAEISVIEA